jgi:hypothetical protein
MAAARWRRNGRIWLAGRCRLDLLTWLVSRQAHPGEDPQCLDAVAPGGQPVRLHLELPRRLLQGLTTRQPQHRIGLLPSRLTRLRPIVLALLVVIVHRHEGHLHPLPIRCPTQPGAMDR